MRCEVIAIGTELTTGAKLDTNSQWLSVELAAVGLPVLAHTTIADDLPALIESLRMAVRRSDVVLITGGLGPTLDDLTREAVARLAGVELVFHEQSLRHIRNMFAKRKREMPERNVIQAQFPAGSDPIDNPHGTAPGIWLEMPRDGGGKCLIAAMPGVPSEMKPMFRDQVLPRLPRSDRVIRRARVNCFGVGESATNFIFARSPLPGRELFKAMLRQGVIVRPLDEYGLQHHIRVSIGTAAQNKALFAALKNVLGSKVVA